MQNPFYIRNALSYYFWEEEREVNLQLGEREMLHNQVCSVLRKAILKSELKAGEKLVQAELADKIGVSRMPIREALRTLELEGLVTIEPHKGAVVKSISKKDIEELYELRVILEPLALMKSMPHFTEEDLQLLDQCYQGMISTTGEAYIELNKKFHQILLYRCDSRRLLSFIETISHGFAQETPEIIPGQMEKSNKEHARLLEYIVKGEKDQAAECLANHIERSGKELLTALENRDFR